MPMQARSSRKAPQPITAPIIARLSMKEMALAYAATPMSNTAIIYNRQHHIKTQTTTITALNAHLDQLFERFSTHLLSLPNLAQITKCHPTRLKIQVIIIV